MNNINDKSNLTCSSCGVCAVICPHRCIDIKQNNEGFYAPILNEDKCTSCGLCRHVCYKYIEQPSDFNNFFADKNICGAWSKDEYTLATATSGGVGHELLKWGIENGYEACGVVFDAKNNYCKHAIAKNVEEILQYKSSKYLQSFTVEAFSDFAKNKKYIVVGTPCQIYGLRQLIKIRKKENDFILIDFFCHGTPSMLLWQKYKEYIQTIKHLDSFKEVLFRSKEESTWHLNTMKITDWNNKIYLNRKGFTTDLFFNFFLSDTCLNEACYTCLLRLDGCASDIRIADFWGEKYNNDENGVTLVAVNTERGKFAYDNIKARLNIEQCTFEDLKKSQPTRFHHIDLRKREKVLSLFKSNHSLAHIYKKTIKDFFLKDLRKKIKFLMLKAIKSKI